MTKLRKLGFTKLAKETLPKTLKPVDIKPTVDPERRLQSYIDAQNPRPKPLKPSTQKILRSISKDLNAYKAGDKKGWDRKYQIALAKNNCLEFRVPNRITSYKQMFRRYELMYQIVDFSITKPNGRFSTLLNKVKPTILSMYEGDTTKTDMILSLAKDFYKFVKDGTISNSIEEFIR